MNTIKSVYYGWATLIVAGGGAYFFAKRSINADRAEKAELDRQKRMRVFQMEQELLHQQSSTSPQSQTQSRFGGAGSGIGGGPGHSGGAEESGNPSVQAGRDPAPTGHEGGKGRYEANDVYRSRKGDRFS